MFLLLRSVSISSDSESLDEELLKTGFLIVDVQQKPVLVEGRFVGSISKSVAEGNGRAEASGASEGWSCEFLGRACDPPAG